MDFTSANWTDIPIEKQDKMLEDISRIVGKIEKNTKKINEADVMYWRKKGWLDRKQPWK